MQVKQSRLVRPGLVMAVLIGLMLGLALPAQATLVDRGGGFIYDDVLNITWTQNAGLSGGGGIPGIIRWPGRMR